MHEDPRIVVIGGGTGSFVVLSGLKKYSRNITALVNMVDDGGSTGHLRDELGVLPTGDVRQCLVALSSSPKMRDLFNYRFDEGALGGHSFGNLFLTVLEKISGDFTKAVELASEVLSVSGVVEPVTLSDVQLCASDVNKTVCGQHAIECAEWGRRPRLWLTPEAVPNPRALEAIRQADMIVIAPGSLYTSLAPVLIVPGVGRAIIDAKAPKLFVCNLVTKPGQTDDFAVHDFADEIERFVGQPFLTHVLYNTALPSQELLSKYAHEREFAVAIDESTLKTRPYASVGRAIISKRAWRDAQRGDVLAASRTYIRHDSDVLAAEIMKFTQREPRMPFPGARTAHSKPLTKSP